MVSIRLQRTGRRRHAQFRLVVQDSRRSPTSGRVIAVLGFYNPHTKEHKFDLEKAAAYLANGAQPSARAAKLLSDQKVKLPAWVKPPPQRSDGVRHPDKLRRNRPAEAAPEKPAEEKAAAEGEETPPAEPAAETENAESASGETKEEAGAADKEPSGEAAAGAEEAAGKKDEDGAAGEGQSEKTAGEDGEKSETKAGGGETADEKSAAGKKKDGGKKRS